MASSTAILPNYKNLTPKQKAKQLQNLVLDEVIKVHEENKAKKRGDIQRIVDFYSQDFKCVTRDNFNNRWRALKAQRKAAEAAANQNSAAETLAAKETKGLTADTAAKKTNKPPTQREMEALHWVTMENRAAKDRLAPGHKMKAGTMQLLKVQARQKFQLPTTWNPSDETIRTRLKKRIYTVNPRKGPKSPVDPSVERTVVEMATAFQKRTGRSMSQSGIIQLVNDLIKGKPILEQEIIDWQLLYCPHIRKRFETTKERPTSANLGAGWYKGFRERNPDFAMVVRNGTTI